MSSFSHDLSWFKKSSSNKELVARLKKIRLIITDVDGSLTDGNVLIPRSREEKELKGISMQNDFGMSKLLETNIHLAIITGRKNHAFKAYCKNLGIDPALYFEGIDKEKFKAVRKIQAKLKMSREQTLLFGDDYLDFEAQSFVELYAVPENTPFYLQPCADLVVPKNGGQGAFRLLLDLILFVQKKHFAQKLISKLVE